MKRTKIFGVEIIYLCLIGILFAFFGWQIENIARFIGKGIIDSRYHFLPFIFPYGLISLAYHLFLGSPDEPKFLGKNIFKTKPNKKQLFIYDLIVVSFICLFVFMGAFILFKLIYKPILKIIINKISYKVAFIIVFTIASAILCDSIFYIIQMVCFN